VRRACPLAEADVQDRLCGAKWEPPGDCQLEPAVSQASVDDVRELVGIGAGSSEAMFLGASFLFVAATDGRVLASRHMGRLPDRTSKVV